MQKTNRDKTKIKFATNNIKQETQRESTEEKQDFNIEGIKDCYSKNLHHDIQLMRWCIAEWKHIFGQYTNRVCTYENNVKLKDLFAFETNDLQNIFYDLESFDKRCENLNELCLCQQQFGKDKSMIMPIFGGTKRYEIKKQMEDIESKM